MKRLVCVCLLLAVCIGAVSCGNAKVDVPSGMKLASEESDSFYLFVPTAWSFKRAYDMPYAYYSASDASNITVMQYIIPAENDTDTATGTATETAAETEKQNPRAPYIDKYWEGFLKEADVSLSAFAVLETTETALNDYYAKQYVYTQKTAGVEYKHRQIVTYDGSMIFCLTYSAKAENYDSHTEDVDKIFTEFKFKK